MKIALGMRLQSGPFGGGNQFGKALSSYLIKQGISVVFDLKNDNIDIILLTDPRSYLSSYAFGPIEISNYLKVKPDVILVQRINECDQRKGTLLVNRQLVLANSIMDHTIYIGTWLVDLFKDKGFIFTDKYSIILNGGDREIFQYKHHELNSEKIKIVTHHWGASWLKGWDVYLRLDKLLEKSDYKDGIEFHYIGNVPKDVVMRNIIVHKPCAGIELAKMLQQHDIYLTASINEPAGMHHIEGALCGLPLLYRNSGALPEYCQGFGVSFDGVDDFEEALNTIIENFDYYSSRMIQYNNTSEKMCSEYLKLFDLLYKQKDEVIASRARRNVGFLRIVKLKILFFCFKILNRLGIS